MAFLFRRVLSAGKLPYLLHPRWIGNLSHLTLVLYGEAPSGAPTNDTKNEFSRSGFYPLLVNRRGFAKGRKSNEDNSATIQDFQDIGPSVKLSTNSLMEAAIAALSRELSKIRTGRASSGMLDHIIVDTGSVKAPLNHVAVVSVIDAHTLSVTPYDSNTLKAIENAIVSSPLGINPTPGDQRLIALIPPLTKENIQAMCKVVMKCAEDGKQSIRRARQKCSEESTAMKLGDDFAVWLHEEKGVQSFTTSPCAAKMKFALDTIKKSASSMSKDEVKRLEKEIEDITKRFIKLADDMSKAKEKEITGS